MRARICNYANGKVTLNHLAGSVENDGKIQVIKPDIAKVTSVDMVEQGGITMTFCGLRGQVAWGAGA